jgi:hypothetical protein
MLHADPHHSYGSGFCSCFGVFYLYFVLPPVLHRWEDPDPLRIITGTDVALVTDYTTRYMKKMVLTVCAVQNLVLDLDGVVGPNFRGVLVGPHCLFGHAPQKRHYRCLEIVPDIGDKVHARCRETWRLDTSQGRARLHDIGARGGRNMGRGARDQAGRIRSYDGWVSY